MTTTDQAALDPATAQWLEGVRKIPAEIAARCGVVTINGNLAFEYRMDGLLRYRKIRVLDRETGEKSFMRDRKNAETCLFLEHTLQEDPDLSSPLVICEGEIDALSLVAAGVPNVVSVPDGAQHKEEGTGKIIPSEDKAFGWLWCETGLKPHLARFERVIIATDSDKPGRVLREELAVRFERWRCDYVVYPDGCKDANDVLVKFGADAVHKLIETAKPVVPNTLVSFGDIQDYSYGEIFSSGFKGLDDGLKFGIVAPELMVISGTPGSGKALAVDTEIPTPRGWATMGELAVGDVVYSEAGMPCRVTHVTDVMFGRPCYRLTFSDGAQIVADAEHRWLTSTRKSRVSADNARRKNRQLFVRPKGKDQTHLRTFPSVVTTREIAATVRVERDRRLNHAVELAAPISGMQSILPVEPYVLGVWLGDGRSRDAGMCLWEADMVQEMRAAVGHDLTPWGDGKSYNIPGLTVKLRHIGVLQNKHIPAVYQRALVEDRIALLQGLMDTDGHISDKSRRCEFCNTNERLARDVFDLACGLGLKATMSIGNATLDGRIISKKYRICFQPSPMFSTFRLPRKKARESARSGNRIGRRYIVACDPVESVPVKCIAVDSPSRLFLATRRCIPTHNSEFAACLGANLVHHHQLPGAIMQFEDRSARVRETLTRYALGNIEGMNDRTSARAWVAKWFWTIEPQQNISQDVDYDLEWLKATLREARVRHGCRWVVLDPWNELDHIWDRTQSETVYINDALRKLKRIARALQMILIIVVHPSKEGGRQQDITEKDLYGISGSAAWANKADHGIIIHRPDHSKPDVYVKVAKSKDHSIMGHPGIVRMVYDLSGSKYRYVGMGV